MRRYIELALKLAQQSTYHQQIGCVVIKKNRIVGVGFNKGQKTHPKSKHAFKSIHAELAALLNAGQENAYKATVVIARKYKDNTLANAHPCPSCMLLLKEMRVKRIVYTNNNSWEIKDL